MGGVKETHDASLLRSCCELLGDAGAMAGDGQGTKTARGVQVSEVQAKVVGENLDVLREFDKRLTLSCTCAGKTCTVSLSSGKGSFSAVSLQAARPP